MATPGRPAGLFVVHQDREKHVCECKWHTDVLREKALVNVEMGDVTLKVWCFKVSVPCGVGRLFFEVASLLSASGQAKSTAHCIAQKVRNKWKSMLERRGCWQNHVLHPYRADAAEAHSGQCAEHMSFSAAATLALLVCRAQQKDKDAEEGAQEHGQELLRTWLRHWGMWAARVLVHVDGVGDVEFHEGQCSRASQRQLGLSRAAQSEDTDVADLLLCLESRRTLADQYKALLQAISAHVQQDWRRHG